MNNNQKIFDVLYAGGLCWTANKEDTYTKDGGITGAYCIRRSDTGAVIGNVDSKYKPYQNEMLVREFIDATKELGLTSITANSIDGGRKVVVKARIGDIQIGKDTVHRYITGSNMHDGTSQIKLGMYQLVQVCTNGMMREISSHEIAKVKHTTNATEKMSWYIQNLPTVIKMEEEMMLNYQKLADVKVNEKHIKAIIEKVYEVKTDAPKDEISTRKQNLVKQFDNALTQNGLNVHGDTLWGVLQAMTYINSRDKYGKLQDGKNMIGSPMEKSLMTYEMLMEMIGNPEYEMA